MNKVGRCCIIDDDPIFIYGTKRIMKETDFYEDLIVYSNGQEALEGLDQICTLGKKIPDVIFLDLNMPIMDGWEFLDQFIRLHGDKLYGTLIYILSSSVNPRDLEKVKNYKVVNKYILKPITPNDLENVVQTLKTKR
ncbi:DNA-binding response regulator [Maribacter algicola]|uniref:DNA-binding response regulator n=1 Tax=Maribacter algicola TaxID=2498892 RepID=A0A3R8R259_9FLAO|nr:response regulator [Maribacter algicola]RRQ50278.1 DNA-binding response regulator [Maribacter algicola]